MKKIIQFRPPKKGIRLSMFLDREKHQPTDQAMLRTWLEKQKKDVETR